MATTWTLGSETRDESTEKLFGLVQSGVKQLIGDFLLQRASWAPLDSKSSWGAFEVESLLTDGVNMVNARDRVVKESASDRLYAEFQHFMIECSPARDADLKTANDYRSAVAELMAIKIEAADKCGVRLTSIATPQAWTGSRVLVMPDNERHRRMIKERMPLVGFSAIGASFQSHRATPCSIDNDRLYRTMLLLQLLALSANSYSQVDLGIHCLRYPHTAASWSFSFYPWRTFDEFVDTVTEHIKDGIIGGPEDLHGWVKLCQGSLEGRIWDNPGCAETMVALHALWGALIEHCYVLSGLSSLYLMCDYNQIRRLQQQTQGLAAHGLSDLDHTVMSPYERRELTLKNAYTELRERVGPIMREKGYDYEEALLFDRVIGQQDNGATRQKSWIESGLGPSQVLDADNVYLRDSIVRLRSRVL
jgi:hypothetical protein